MALLSLQEVCVRFGGPLILDRVSLQIERGERVCLLGRNGAGKSTLLKLINGEIEPDSGDVVRQKGLHSSYLSQEIPRYVQGTVFDIVLDGLREPDRSRPQDEVDHDWEKHHQVDKVISLIQLDADSEFRTLSSGLKRRVLLARGLVRQPEILLLDEPTNHLDIASIDWLEEFLLRYKGTIFFVTHDRVFLNKIANRIIELDRGQLADWTCDYQSFLLRKQAVLDAEEKQRAVFDKKLAQEEIWLRQGIKARRTRNEGRVRALEKMRAVRRERRLVTGTVRMKSHETERSGAKIIQVKDLGYRYDDISVIKNFSTTIMRGDKVGIIGPNGSGKTTLLRLLLGELTPQEGTVHNGTHLQITYFDQLRAQLKEDKTVHYNVGEGSDFITFNGKQRHVMSYLQDFLFSPDRARTAASVLSGGERNRLLLARLFTRPSNVLVMDEPTNDLDIETLELLEELLVDYKGTLLLVSHDRAFLNNVVTSTIVFEGEGGVNEYVGGYDDWLRQRQEVEKASKKRSDSKPELLEKKRERPRKLSFKEKRELEILPEQIEALETEQDQLHQTMGDPLFYQKQKDEIVDIKRRLTVVDTELADAYQRWEALEKQQE
ncbi:MAG: ATP-binding cassette domain-containing protein [Candidatus Scalindua sp. AMX11]|nr:MAG: ATP-binding cassette domain-containing protein [Candidatus Scalindua sp.]NOG84761.1 ATP-binding cassette domain-containing protein [Planctomycetota bacterium]RZV98363.1 MAG: ATP-binding cassette domain-containing protein [Candidatus Scalindua sp. SCAELEC01]TDE66544.1 MAG: ATP-binding cassette domain-containing protein [Candidatus Scalindua sp. AMX11]GJQ58909.1 MAG: ABC transporter ATP-binding protein [Candidatus Scalindua sp.]